MPTHYVMKEMPDLQGKGRTGDLPANGIVGTKFNPRIGGISPLRSGFSPGMVEGIICELAGGNGAYNGAGLFGKDRRHRYVHSGAGDRRRQGA